MKASSHLEDPDSNHFSSERVDMNERNRQPDVFRERREQNRGYGRGDYTNYRRHSDSDGRKHDSNSNFERTRHYSRDEDRYGGNGNGFGSSCRCQECGSRNDRRDSHCRHCNVSLESFQYRERSNSTSNRWNDRGGFSREDRSLREGHRYQRHHDRDYYGRNDPHPECDDRQHKKRRNSKDHVPTREWPPVFESSGASYVFDARSGLFYEASSNFFYDPKTKLYFSNKKQKYFQHCEEEKSLFREVANKAELEKTQSATDTADPVVQALGGTTINNAFANSKGSGKKKIAISLKKKVLETKDKSSSKSTSQIASLNSSAEKDSVCDIAPVSTLQKQHHADMEKWNQRCLEINDEDKKDNAHPEKPLATEMELSDTLSNSNNKIKMTVTGKPICMLCKRKFLDVDKLRQHELKSELHKQNLLKLKVSAAANKSQEPQGNLTNYRDRAKERRILNGPEQAIPETFDNSQILPSAAQARNVTVSENVTPEQILGEKNIGNKMLQKLGWKGGSLGRSESSTLKDTNDNTVARSNTQNTLKADWERIESLATKNGRS
mmetsp:Transcript_8445/g.12041  ORF Transcript_8445/g.12041 Transcript_8445/m.12041 type:complete len:552 (+) Transcript_8445:106-1761(+)